MGKLKKLYTDEFKKTISVLLQVEKEEMINRNRGSKIYNEYEEIASFLMADLITNSMQIHLIELEELINVTYPFIKDLGAEIIPYCEMDYFEKDTIGIVYVDDFVLQSYKVEPSYEQYEEFNELVQELLSIYRGLDVSFQVVFEEFEEDFGVQYLRVIEIV
ncbi:hypothetical protein [Heyndrickxia oleronia]